MVKNYNFKKYLSIYLAAWGLSCGTRDLSWVMRDLLLLCTYSPVVASAVTGCDAWAQLLQDIWDLSSLTRDWTHVPCIARQILNHRTTREAPGIIIYKAYLYTLLSLILTEVLWSSHEETEAQRVPGIAQGWWSNKS